MGLRLPVMAALAVALLAGGCVSASRPPVSKIRNTSFSLIDADALVMMTDPRLKPPFAESELANVQRLAENGDKGANFKMGQYMEMKTLAVTFDNYRQLIPLEDTIKHTPAYLDYMNAALGHYTRAADAGEDRAMVRLGEMYRVFGLAAPRPYQSISKSVLWFEKAHAAGNTDASCQLGDMLLNGYSAVGMGESLAADKPRGLKYLAEGGDKGNVDCLSKMMSLNHIDLGRMAFAKLKVIAENGSGSEDSVKAQEVMAARALMEKHKMAAEWYERLLKAKPDHLEALHGLARVYKEGMGVPVDEAKAATYQARADAVLAREVAKPGAVQMSLSLLRNGDSLRIIPGLANAAKVLEDEEGFHKLMRYRYSCTTQGDARVCRYPQIMTSATFRDGRLREVVTHGLNRYTLDDNLPNHFGYSDTPYTFARKDEPLCRDAASAEACRWRFWYDLKEPTVEKIAVQTSEPAGRAIREVRVYFKGR